MKKQENSNYRPVQTNLIRQNCYLREIVSLPVQNRNKTEKYVSLDAVTDQDGVHIVETEQDYPITPQYVKSFESSADYKSNLAESLNAPPRGVNISDCTDIQRLSKKDLTELVNSYKAIYDKIVQASHDASTQDKTESKTEVTNE